MTLALDTANVWWIAILAVVAVIGGVGGWAFSQWRRGRRDDAMSNVLDFVDWILDALEKETARLLREIPQAEVEAAARLVYDQFISGTGLVAFVPREAFVRLVVDQWRMIAGVGGAVTQAVALAQQQAAAQWPPGPPG